MQMTREGMFQDNNKRGLVTMMSNLGDSSLLRINGDCTELEDIKEALLPCSQKQLITQLLNQLISPSSLHSLFGSANLNLSSCRSRTLSSLPLLQPLPLLFPAPSPTLSASSPFTLAPACNIPASMLPRAASLPASSPRMPAAHVPKNRRLPST